MFVLGVILLHKSNQCMLYLCCFVAGINKLAVIVELRTLIIPSRQATARLFLISMARLT